MHAKTETRLSEVLYWEMFASLLPTRTRPTVLTPLSANHEVTVGCRLHVAHDASTARNNPTLEFFSFDIKPDQHVRPDRRLDIPDGAVEVGNPIRLGLRSTWGRPVRDFAGLRIQAAEIATRIVGIPDDVVRADRDAPRPAFGVG